MYENKQSATLVILPGLLCDSRMFSAQLAAFPDARVVDGYYGSAAGLEAMADHALARMPDRVSLFGHSMGARVALEVMRKAPGRVERLALADTGIHMVRPGEAVRRHALRDIGREQGMEALVDRWLPPMLAAEARQDANLVAMLRAMSVDAGIAIYEAQIDALLNRPSVDDLLPRIACPTTAIVGSADEWAPPSQHQDIVNAIAGAQLHVIEGAGHMAPTEKPEAFNAAIREWMARPAIRN